MSQYTLSDRNPEREDIVANNGAHLHIANALYLWESGDFSPWAEKNGFPLTISGVEFEGWDGVEDALINFPCGPYDPRELSK
jgi:hypothetical protein